MRAWLLTSIIIAMIAGSLLLVYKKLHVPSHIMPLSRSFQLLGVIDMDTDHGVDLKRVLDGDDILLVLDRNGYDNQFVPNHPEYNQFYSKPFDLVYFDPDGEGVLDSEDSLWNYLYAVVYSDAGQTYHVRRLREAGIHAILTRHLTPQGNHAVLLSDGDRRTLYEVPVPKVSSDSVFVQP
jgi:hypothetical protein